MIDAFPQPNSLDQIVRAGQRRLIRGPNPDSIIMSGVVIGKNARIKRAIIDKWAEIPAGESIGHDLEADVERFHVGSTGVVVVPRASDMIRDWDVAMPTRR